MPPLRCPKKFGSKRHFFDRCASFCSLFPPPAAVATSPGTWFWRPLLYQLSYTPIYSLLFGNEPIKQTVKIFTACKRVCFKLNADPIGWWAIRDSNPGPTGYEPVALTN